jgi:hypothetical protein
VKKGKQSSEQMASCFKLIYELAVMRDRLVFRYFQGKRIRLRWKRLSGTLQPAELFATFKKGGDEDD